MFNVALSKGNPDLADVVPGSIKFGSVAGSHLNAFLRSVNAECECSIEDEPGAISKRGRLNKACFTADEDFLDAIENGIKWRVIRGQVRDKYPQVPHKLQAAFNAVGHVQRGENEVQCMMNCFRLLKQCWPRQPWDEIRRDVARGKSAHVDEVPDFAVFLNHCSGGTEGAFLMDLDRFHRSHVNSGQRRCKGQFLAGAATSGLPPALVIAAVKTNYSGPKESIKNGICCYVSDTELKSFSKKTLGVTAALAESHLRECRQLALTAAGKVSDTLLEELWQREVVVRALAVLDISTMRLALEKKEAKHKDLGVIKAEFMSTLATALPELKPYFEDAEHGSTPGRSENSSAKVEQVNVKKLGVRMIQYDAAGNTTDSLPKLHAQGIDVGAVVSAEKKLVDTTSGLALEGPANEGKPTVFSSATILTATELGKTPDNKRKRTPPPVVFVVRHGDYFLVLPDNLESGEVRMQQIVSTDELENARKGHALKAGQTITMSVDVFLEHFAVAGSPKIWTQHEHFPSCNQAATSKEYRIAAVSGLMLSSLRQCSHALPGEISKLVRIDVKPVKRVVTGEKVSAKRIVLVPDTLSIRVVDGANPKDEGVDTSAMFEIQQISEPIEHVRFFVLPCFSELLVAPFSYVQPTHERQEANLVVEWVTVTTVSACEFPAGLRTRDREKTPMPSNQGGEFSCRVPVLTNSAEVEAGVELLYYTPKKVAPTSVKPIRMRGRGQAKSASA